MSSTTNIICCTPKHLSNGQAIRASLSAHSINPANRPPVERMVQAGIEHVTAERIAVLTTKWWHSGGVNLTVGFRDNVSKKQADKILAYANKWGSKCNVQFTLIPIGWQKAQVRIGFTPGDGYWSYLGVDILQIPSSEITMNLEGFGDESTPDSEFDRVVCHEFGHTLGCPHEHMRAEIVANIDPTKAENYFFQTQNWTAQEVEQQVLKALDQQSIMGTPHADITSIMCYQLPGVIMKDGKPVPGGSQINDLDFSFMASIYPKVVTPVQPPVTPPVQPPSAGKWSITLPAGTVVTGTGTKPVIV